MLKNLNNYTPLIATIVIPVMLAVIGNQYSNSMKEREIQGEFVALAVDILKQKPSEGSRNIREWATAILNKYSGVQMSDAARDDLINNISFEIAEDFEVKESGLSIDMNGGPVSVTVEFENGHSGDYHIELLVDGNFDNQVDNEPLVFLPATIEALHQWPADEQDSIIQMTVLTRKISANNEYRANVIFTQNGREITREVVQGEFAGPEADRTLMININEIK